MFWVERCACAEETGSPEAAPKHRSRQRPESGTWKAAGGKHREKGALMGCSPREGKAAVVEGHKVLRPQESPLLNRKMRKSREKSATRREDRPAETRKDPARVIQPAKGGKEEKTNKTERSRNRRRLNSPGSRSG